MQGFLKGKYKIGCILNKKTKQSVCSHYTNKLINKVICDIGKELIVFYVSDGHFSHEKVINVLEDDYGFWIETTNKEWRFDHV